MTSPMFFTRAGKTQTLQQWSEELGVSYSTLYARIRTLGIPAERALDPDFKRRTGGRNPKRYTHGGRTLTQHQWAEEIGITDCALRLRFGRGLPLERALAIGKLKQRTNIKRYTHDGKTMTLPEWAKHAGLTYGALMQRLARHSLADALAIPPRRIVRRKHRGVPSDLEGLKGTGAGSTAQEIHEITFAKQADNA